MNYAKDILENEGRGGCLAWRFSPPFPLPLRFKALHHLCDIMR